MGVSNRIIATGSVIAGRRKVKREKMEDYFDKGFLLVIADVLSIITISSCLVCKIPQIKTISALKSAKGEWIY